MLLYSFIFITMNIKNIQIITLS